MRPETTARSLPANRLHLSNQEPFLSMHTSFFRSKFVAAGAAVLLAVGLVGGSTVAFADTPPSGDAPPPPHAGPGKPGPGGVGFGLAVGLQDLIKSRSEEHTSELQSPYVI